MGYSASTRYALQFHQEGQSPYSYKFAKEELHWHGSNSHLVFTFMKQTDTLKNNKHSYTCNEDNQNHFVHCLENYYSKRLGCLLPWSIKEGQDDHSGNVCKSKDKFMEFKNISMNILRTEETNNLIKQGCFLPNCQQQSWDIKKEKFHEQLSL